MKGLILFAIFSISYLSAKGQSEKNHFDFDTDNSVMVLHTKEISKSKDSLYLLAKKWLNTTSDYTSPIVLIDDKSNGHISANCTHVFSDIITIKYTIDIYVKENKYRLYIHNISLVNLDNKENFTSDYNDYLAKFKDNPRLADVMYDKNVGDAFRFFSNLQNSLDGSFNEQSDKSVF